MKVTRVIFLMKFFTDSVKTLWKPQKIDGCVNHVHRLSFNVGFKKKKHGGCLCFSRRKKNDRNLPLELPFQRIFKGMDSVIELILVSEASHSAYLKAWLIKV